MPLVNPDGVRIALTRDKLWKANAKGVDLNVNFDARWGKGRRNVFSPAAENYVGPMPCSARNCSTIQSTMRASKSSPPR